MHKSRERYANVQCDLGTAELAHDRFPRLPLRLSSGIPHPRHLHIVPSPRLVTSRRHVVKIVVV